MAWSKVLTFNDPHSYTAAVLTADMQLFPTAKGEFRAELTQVVLNQLRMQRFEENLPRVHTGAGQAGAQGVHLPHGRSARSVQSRQGVFVRRNLRGRLRATARTNRRELPFRSRFAYPEGLCWFVQSDSRLRA